MKPKWNTRYWIVIIVWVGCLQAFAEPFAKGPYLGQAPPGPIPKVFAPGLICHSGPNKWEGNATFSADGNTFCFQRVSGVFITENTDKGWTTPELITSIPANIWSPWSACLSPDANSIYFIIAERHPRHKHLGLFRCDRTTHGWSKPQLLGPPLSSSVRETSCSIAANNNIYLCSSRKGWDGKSGIWVVPFMDNTWPRAIHLSIDHPLGNDPGIAPDESFMVIYSIRPGAIPGTETNLYLTLRRPDGTWTKPRDMGPRINTRYYEHGARISPDKKYLFFNRCEGWDPRIYTSDIYWVELKEYLPESYRSPNGMVNGNRGPMKRKSVMKQITGIDSVQALPEPIAKGPYLGQSPPGPIAQVFAPGLICDTQPHRFEIHGHFSADGNTFCFRRLGYIYITENTEQGWTTPKLKAFHIGPGRCVCLRMPIVSTSWINISPGRYGTAMIRPNVGVIIDAFARPVDGLRLKNSVPPSVPPGVDSLCQRITVYTLNPYKAVFGLPLLWAIPGTGLQRSLWRWAT